MTDPKFEAFRSKYMTSPPKSRPIKNDDNKSITCGVELAESVRERTLEEEDVPMQVDEEDVHKMQGTQQFQSSSTTLPPISTLLTQDLHKVSDQAAAQMEMSSQKMKEKLMDEIGFDRLRKQARLPVKTNTVIKAKLEEEKDV